MIHPSSMGFGRFWRSFFELFTQMNLVKYLHFRILKFLLIDWNHNFLWEKSWIIHDFYGPKDESARSICRYPHILVARPRPAAALLPGEPRTPPLVRTGEPLSQTAARMAAWRRGKSAGNMGFIVIFSLVNQHNYRKSPCSKGKSIAMEAQYKLHSWEWQMLQLGHYLRWMLG